MLLQYLLVVGAAVASSGRSPAWDRDVYWRRPGPPEKRVKVFLYPSEDYLEDKFLNRNSHGYYTSNRYPDQWRRSGDVWYHSSRAPRIQVGEGRYRLLGRSNSAELQCHFPEQDYVVLSNIIWTRSDLTEGDLQSLLRLDDELPDHFGTVTTDGQESTLFLNHVTPLDLGWYRCMATARNIRSSLVSTIYQDTYFYTQL